MQEPAGWCFRPGLTGSFLWPQRVLLLCRGVDWLLAYLCYPWQGWLEGLSSSLPSLTLPWADPDVSFPGHRRRVEMRWPPSWPPKGCSGIVAFVSAFVGGAAELHGEGQDTGRHEDMGPQRAPSIPVCLSPGLSRAPGSRTFSSFASSPGWSAAQ